MKHFIKVLIFVGMISVIGIAGTSLGDEQETKSRTQSGGLRLSFPSLIELPTRELSIENRKISRILTDGRFCVAEDPASTVRCGIVKAFKPLEVEWNFKGDLPGAMAEFEKHQRTLFAGETLQSALRKLAEAGFPDALQVIGWAYINFESDKWRIARYYRIGDDKILSIIYSESNHQAVIEEIFQYTVDNRLGRITPKILDRKDFKMFVLPASPTE